MDADPEILHQYRVSLRRSVSLLKLYRRDCPWRKAIKGLLERTNTIRELDVLLKGIDANCYPKLHRRLTHHRDDQFALSLGTSQRQASLRDLEKLINDADAPGAARWFKSLGDDRLIDKALDVHADSLRRYEGISHDASSEAFHRLRIRFKISRYALAFLTDSGLHDAGKEIERIKRIQDKLGFIQDMTNQIDVLKRFCSQWHSPGCVTLIRQREEAINRAKRNKKA